jgi:2,3-bisphosphoglycerate-dependent phosphoglycerate mutase
MPSTFWLVRHGESAANVARAAAHAAGLPEMDLALRDADVPLSALGERQATALGRWFSERDPAERPTVVVASPYRRALDTARLVVAAGGTARGVAHAADDLVIDERLREKELGHFYHLMRVGIEERHPEEWALRTRLGPFYYRPPGGESWCDVVLRLRSALDSLAARFPGERVMVVCHQIVIYCARYILEEIPEERLLAVARERDVPNCSVTRYVPEAPSAPGRPPRLALAEFAFTVPVEAEGTPVTTEPPRGGARDAQP